MLAIAFQVGDHALALPASRVVELLPRRSLRPIAMAPEGVIGLLAFRGALVPVVDLCRLALGRDSRPLRSTRLIVLSLPQEDGQRLVGLLAESVLDLVTLGDTLPGLPVAGAPWLGEHLAGSPGMPQLVDPMRLLPVELAALYQQAASE
ncbi:MAG: chemotaxis protein CheW [Arenimonas sp.]|uniref:chemotaxis protein CheW n=1 Tax=Arenimonas sp. TaxID=1872635 RepID=UPI0025C240F3|nr:chemotaxis protein CheW [Arenimonas sp.]MBW8366908.1 chemotaxis protein CheW [Arenimonas sp.]